MSKRRMRGRLGTSVWNWVASPVCSTTPPQPGQASGKGASRTSSTRSGVRRWACRPWAGPGLRPGRLGRSLGGPLEKGGGLALGLARRLVALGAEGLVLLARPLVLLAERFVLLAQLGDLAAQRLNQGAQVVQLPQHADGGPG